MHDDEQVADKEQRAIPANSVGHDTRVRTGFSLLGVGLAVLLAAAAFFSGFQMGGNHQLEASISSIFADNATSDSSVDLSEFWQVWNLLGQKFVSSTTTKPLTSEDKVRGAIEGLVNAYGDPYTVFMPPQDASRFADDIAGNFSGVGMEIGMRDGLLTVIAPLPDSPADKAGILSGDVIMKIDDKSTDGMSIDQAVNLIRGEKGTTVTLSIVRKGEKEVLDKTVTRDTIKIPTTLTSVKGDAFVIKLYSFNALSEGEMEKSLRAFVTSGKQDLVLDLRGNPGGFLQSAVSIASYFLPAGKVVVRESFGPNQPEKVYRSSGKTLHGFAPKKVVILVDGGSASAAEILSGALQQQGVATLIGAQTFGKGSVQELVDLKDGSSLKVTIARWLTPNGTWISEKGITPDIEVDRTPQQFIAGEDPQMDRALEFLKTGK